MSHCVDDGNFFSRDFLLDSNSLTHLSWLRTRTQCLVPYQYTHLSSLTRCSSKLYLNKMSDFPPNPQNLALILHETLIKFKLMSCIRLLSWQIKHLIQHSTYHERNELDFLWSCSNIWTWAYSRFIALNPKLWWLSRYLVPISFLSSPRFLAIITFLDFSPLVSWSQPRAINENWSFLLRHITGKWVRI